MDSFERTTMALSFPNKSRAFDATRRAVRFWGHDSAMEVAFFVTEDALRRVQPHMRLDEAGLLRAFDSNRDQICTTAAKVYAPQRLIRSGELRLLGRADGDTCIPYAERVKPCGSTFSSRKRGRICGPSRATSRAADFR